MPTPKVRVDGKWYSLGLTQGQKVEIINSANAYADQLNAEIQEEVDAINQSLTSLDGIIDGSFKDGIISEAEAKIIKSELRNLEVKKAELDREYTDLTGNNFIHPDSLSALSVAKADYDTKYVNLVNAILDTIADSEASESEVVLVDTAFTNYKNAVQLLVSAMRGAISQIGETQASSALVDAIDYTDNAISPVVEQLQQASTEISQNAEQIALKADSTYVTTEFARVKTEALEEANLYADGLKTATDESISSLEQSIADTDFYIENSFKDGIISTLEASGINNYLNTLNTSKSGFDANYDGLIANTYLSGTPKTALTSAKANIDTAHNNLVSAIQTAIADSVASATEVTDVNTKFDLYNQAVNLYESAVNTAIDAIAQAKALESYDDAVDYTDGELVPVRNTISSHSSELSVQAQAILQRVTSEQHSFDINQTLTSANTYSDNLKTAIDSDISALSGSLADTQDYIDTSFKDGILYDAEYKRINGLLQSLDETKQIFDARYTTVYQNTDLVGQTKTDLGNAKSLYDTKYTALVNAINTAIADQLATPEEATSVNTAFTDYKGSVALLGSVLEQAANAIATELSNKAKADAKAYTDGIKSQIDSDLAQVTSDVNATNNYIDNAFKDGVLSTTEAKRIKSYLNVLSQSKTSFDTRVTDLINDADLSSPFETNLNNAKTAYNTAYNNLVSAINTAMADEIASPAEVSDVDVKFSLYNEKTKDLNIAIDRALKDIAQAKANKALTDANSYTDGEISPIAQSVSLNSASIEVLEGEIVKKVSNTTFTQVTGDIDNKVNNIKIGGKNLLANSHLEKTATREFLQYADLAPIIDTNGLVEYTISFDIKIADDSINNSIQVYMQNGSGSRYNFTKYITAGTEYDRRYVVVTPTNGNLTLTQSILAFYGTYDTGAIPSVKNVKVELGNKPTDWTRAEEDVDAKIESEAGAVQDNLDNLKIGGTNLLPLAGFAPWGGGYTLAGYKFTVSQTVVPASGSGIRLPSTNLKPDTEYTLSFKTKKLSGTVHTIAGHWGLANSTGKFYMDGTYVGTDYKATYPNDTNIHEFVLVFTTKTGATVVDYLYIQPNRSSYDQIYSIEVWDIKVEKGNKATDWSSAPEDTEAKIATVQSGLSDLSSDAKITQAERRAIKESMQKITGVSIGNTSTAPTTATMDSSAKGDFYSIRKQALNAGILSSHATYIDVATKYTSLANYLNGLSPKPWDTASTAVITVVADTWRTLWFDYYSAYNKLAELVADTLKKTADAVQTNLNNLTIGSRNLLPDSNHLKYTPGSKPDSIGTWGGNVATISFSPDIPPLFQGGNSVKITVTTSGSGGSFVDINEYFTLEDGKTYTLSFYGKGVEPEQYPSGFIAALNRESDNNYIVADIYIFSTDWARYTYTFTVGAGKGGTYKRRHIKYDTGTVYISHLQLEEGTKVSSWKPAIEDVDLYAPKAGRNYLRNTDFSEIYDAGYAWDSALNGTYVPVGWSLYNSGVPQANIGYHANLYTDFGYPVIRFKDENYDINTSLLHRWMAAVQYMNGDHAFLKEIAPGRNFVLSLMVRGAEGLKLNVGMHHYSLTTGTKAFHGYQWNLDPIEYDEADRWVRRYVTFRIDNDWDTNPAKDVSLYIYGYMSTEEGTQYIKDIMLEEGVFPSSWRASQEDVSLRISTVENDVTELIELTKPDGLYTQISQSTNYLSKLEEFALATDLEGLAVADNVTNEIANAVKPYKEFLEDLDTSPYAKQADYAQTVEKFEARFRAGGGANLLMNSVGFNDLNFWAKSSNNLLPNSTFSASNPFEGYIFTNSTEVGVGTGLTFYGINPCKFAITGRAADGYVSIYSPFVTCTGGEDITVSAWLYIQANHGIDNSWRMGIEFYDASARLALVANIPPMTTVDKWFRHSYAYTAPAGTTRVRLRFYLNRNGVAWIAAPQIESGTVLTSYAPSIADPDIGLLYTRQNETLQGLGTGSSIMVKTGGKLIQTVTLPPIHDVDGNGVPVLIPFTFSVITKMWVAGTGYIRIYDGSAMSNNYVETPITSGDYKKHTATIVPSSGTVTVEICTTTGDIEFTGNMLNVGDVPFQWQQNTKESHNATVRQDITGIKVFSTADDGAIESMTAMTPEKFAGYYDVNQDGVIDTNTDSPDEVFRMDKDEFKMKKAVVKEEITMGNIKIVNTATGWAIVGLD